uniref:Uncharacterized protein n=1 Tax=Rhizophora mucronata TaxID=61149 RepID=A0A2P2PTM9_RHIMU
MNREKKNLLQKKWGSRGGGVVRASS